jgi:ribosomal protein S18 acetylase RimI-like enzyme
MPQVVVPIAEEHIDGFRAALDSVARERRFLSFLEAPPPEAVRKFVRENLAERAVQLVALEEERVIGWCDVLPKPRPTLRHSGVLGIGVVAAHRHRGIGRALLGAALQAARSRGLSRIELTVRVDNDVARRLYERFGFVIEGLCRRYTLVDGEYHDSHLMALVHG